MRWRSVIVTCFGAPRLGGLRALAGEYGAALAAHETARATLQENDPSDVAASIANAIGEIHRRLRRWDVAVISFEELLAVAESLALRCRAAANWAFVEHRRGNGDRARSPAEQALHSAEVSDDPDTEALAHISQAWSPRTKQSGLRTMPRRWTLDRSHRSGLRFSTTSRSRLQHPVRHRQRSNGRERPSLRRSCQAIDTGSQRSTTRWPTCSTQQATKRPQWSS